MFYLKTEIDGKTREVEIYDDEIYSTCFKCGKEFQVQTDLMKHVYDNGGDLSSTSFTCGCNTERPKIVRIK